MRFNLFFASLAAGQVVVNYDRSLEGRLETFEVEETVIDAVGGPAKLGELKNPLEKSDSNPLFGRAALSPNGVLNILSKKYYSCPDGYGYCEGT